MQSALYVSLSAQIALERRMSTIAGNIANTSSTGFRASEVNFAEVLSKVSQSSGSQGTSFVNEGDDFLITKSGGLRETSNPLDFAIKGDAWFLIEGPAGRMLSRDGRFSINDEGVLTSLQGYDVLDPGGGLLQVDPARGPIKAAADGSLSQNGAFVGSIGLFKVDLSAGFKRVGDSGIVAVNIPQAVVDQQDIGVYQGYVENSNVNPVSEMANLITVSRSFENTTTMMRDLNETLKKAIQTIGGSA